MVTYCFEEAERSCLLESEVGRQSLRVRDEGGLERGHIDRRGEGERNATRLMRR